MSYVRFVAGFLRHPKLARCSAKACLLWVAAVDYCVISASDGFLPGSVMASLCPQVRPKSVPRFVSELVNAGLLERRDAGYAIHDYLKYNPSKAQLESEHQAARARYQRWRNANVANAVVTPLATTSPTLPIPTYPPVGEKPPVSPFNNLSRQGSNGEMTTTGDDLEDARKLLAFFNEKTGGAFGEGNLPLIDARLREGWSVQDCRTMIVRKWRDWHDDPHMAPFIRPSTLFNRAKLEEYMGALGYRPSRGR